MALKSGKAITVYVDEGLLNKIDDHWHTNHLPNRSQAVVDIIKLGFDCLNCESKTECPVLKKRMA